MIAFNAKRATLNLKLYATRIYPLVRLPGDGNEKSGEKKKRSPGAVTVIR